MNGAGPDPDVLTLAPAAHLYVEEFANSGIMRVIVVNSILLRRRESSLPWLVRGSSSAASVRRRLSVSTSFMLASLRVLHVDSSGARAACGLDREGLPVLGPGGRRDRCR